MTESIPLPAALSPVLEHHRQRIAERLDERQRAALQATLADRVLAADFDRLLSSSDFFVEQFARHAAWALEALASGALLGGRSPTPETMEQALQGLVSDPDSEASVMTALRIFRNHCMLRIVGRELTGRATLAETFRELTLLADTTIRYAVAWSTERLAGRFGTPTGGDSGEPQELVVLGMGKLGGGELNLSSDIDLIFTYPEAGETQGARRSLTNQEFFIRAGQGAIKLLDAKTVDGFVFRVDMRLRPFGSSGPLVVNYNALEVYYQQHGRDWERYAMIKARSITGSEATRGPLADLKRAFVYRRYTDYGALHALRDMRETISAETLRRNLQDNIKRGYGGIREVEFIVQCKQLIHGGRNPELQVRPLEDACDQLEQLGFITPEDRRGLVDAYRFLRRLENILQGIGDVQTQELPRDDLNRQRLAYLMGFTGWPALLQSIEAVRARVSSYFSELVTLPSVDHPDHPAPDGLQFAELSELGLQALGFAQPAATWKAIEDLVGSARVQAAQTESRNRLLLFLPQLIEVAGRSSHPDLAVTRTLPFANAVLRRSAYLVMMGEHPKALEQLVYLNIASPWIARRLAARPELVEELLHEEKLYAAPKRLEMAGLVQDQLLRVPEDDLEQQMHAMARIKEAVVLRVAASELSGSIPLMKASDNLTYLAEVIVEQAIQVARSELVSRHGEPQGDQPGFAVLGYGKLGGIELGYGSDLDLVFVFEGAGGVTSGPKVIDNSRFFARLAQRVVHVLSTNVANGALYEVDLRLRPEGSSGLPCVTLSGLRKYQQESAWTWEHQALVRARPVAGDNALRNKLEALRLEILRTPRSSQTLQDEVVAMRLRMYESAESRLIGDSDEFDLKRDPGGIVDIEFVVQFLILKHAPENLPLALATDVINLLLALEENDLLLAEDADKLRAAYLAYRAEVHRSVLRDQPALGKIAEHAGRRRDVAQIRDRFLPGLPAP